MPEDTDGQLDVQIAEGMVPQSLPALRKVQLTGALPALLKVMQRQVVVERPQALFTIQPQELADVLVGLQGDGSQAAVLHLAAHRAVGDQDGLEPKRAVGVVDLRRGGLLLPLRGRQGLRRLVIVKERALQDSRCLGALAMIWRVHVRREVLQVGPNKNSPVVDIPHHLLRGGGESLHGNGLVIDWAVEVSRVVRVDQHQPSAQGVGVNHADPGVKAILVDVAQVSEAEEADRALLGAEDQEILRHPHTGDRGVVLVRELPLLTRRLLPRRHRVHVHCGVRGVKMVQGKVALLQHRCVVRRQIHRSHRVEVLLLRHLLC
eukprot:RCo028227